MPSSQSQVNGHKRAPRAQGTSRSESTSRGASSSARARPRQRAQQESKPRSMIEVAASALANAGNAQSRTQGAIAEHRRQLVGRANMVRDMLQGASKLVRSEDEAALGYLERAGQRVEDAARYIEEVDLGRLRSDVQRLARERPGLFVGGALVAGLILGRLFKAAPRAASATMEKEEERDD